VKYLKNMPRLLRINILFAAFLILQIIFSSYKTTVTVHHPIRSDEGFALVELFTSEGCSSCPPADEAVGRLNGWKKNVYILSYHVDYWNYLGWKDVFSNAAYSSRQQKYGDLFHLSSIYTPQIVVNGKAQFVGSDETKLRETIDNDLKETPKTELQIKVQPRNANQLAVSWATNPQKELQINIALVQNFTKDFIQRGENKGQNLNHYFTVRDFRSVPAGSGSNTASLNIPAGLQSSECTVIAFLQNPNTGNIEAAIQSAVP
jgi:hypothetical protein